MLGSWAGGAGAGVGAAASTTLAVVALNVTLSKVELHQVARAAAAAYHRRIGPAGTNFDGDVIFAVCRRDAREAKPLQAEVAAVAALDEAILRGVREAKGREGVPGLADRKERGGRGERR